ncbi:HAD family hydrolase [Streptomyces sp. RKAG337]|uniref:HAD family hydrolase n=1 Tax=Streptomyces sp. RKAG337 TaxID=2893404 RepID=UPI002033ED51|nr:HAD family hydrolase [Streptomyces sp. RKAG337]MCM2425323.1 HAD family hydrolase [Streptomyces sp. RKAG337]
MADDRIDLVIFDCDGVLVDSERLAVRVDALMLAELGWPLTEAEIVERFVGRSHRDLTASIEQQLGRPLPEGWYDRYRPWYRSVFEAELTAVDGITEALGLITLPTCVASSNTHPGLRHSLGLTGLHSRFEGRIFSASEVEHGKPAPDLFLHAARAMGADPAHCVVVEDSRFGVEAARAAGMRAFGYYGGLTPRAWLEGPGTVVFDEMRDLPELLLGGF